jgi:hypothetical protein
MEFRTYLAITLFILLAGVSGLAYYFATKSPAPQPHKEEEKPRQKKEPIDEKDADATPLRMAAAPSQMKKAAAPALPESKFGAKVDAAPPPPVQKAVVAPALPESKFGAKVDAAPQMMIPPPQKAVPPPPPPPMKAAIVAPPPQVQKIVEPARPESKVGGPLEVKAVKMEGKIEDKKTADEIMKNQELTRQKEQAAAQQKMAAETALKVFGKAPPPPELKVGAKVEPARPGVMIGGAFIQPQKMAAEPALKVGAKVEPARPGVMMAEPALKYGVKTIG